MRASTSDRSHRGAVGYGSRWLRTACGCALALRFGPSRPYGWRSILAFLWELVHLPVLAWYLVRLPRLRLELSDEPAGRLIAEHLSLRRWGIPRFRLAQGVLELPEDFAQYMRGRGRQALRTNVGHCRELGITCRHTTVADWVSRHEAGGPGDRRLSTVAPGERWWATSPTGEALGEAWLTVDSGCALLHFLECRRANVRWLLSAAISEWLCSLSCPVLIVNTSDVPLMSPGTQYFQRLLGYSIVHIRAPSSRQSPVSRPEGFGRLLLAAFGVAPIVWQETMPGSLRMPGMHALVWLTALVAVRLVLKRAGWATLVGGLAGVIILVFGIASSPRAPLTYLLCGLALDVLLASFPGLGHRAITMAGIGPAVMLITMLAPRFPSVGHLLTARGWRIPPVSGAIAFGAGAAMLGYLLASLVDRRHGEAVAESGGVSP